MIVALIFYCSACSSKSSHPYYIDLDSKYITGNTTLSVAPHFDLADKYNHNFLGVEQTNYKFRGQNSTVAIQVILNRSAELRLPAIGEWNTVAIGPCLYNSSDSICYTAHVDCHLVRTTIIRTGPKSVLVIRVRNNSREPEELCKKWNPKKLTNEQDEEVRNFNESSDEAVNFKITLPQIKHPS